MAERGRCSCCNKEGAITAENGGLRYHLTDDPDCQESPSSRKCKGVGQPAKGAVSLPETGTGYVCRVAPGPEGCGRPVQLTANGRARSHLDNQGHPCGGGSDWPLAVDAQGNRTDTRPTGTVYPAVPVDQLLIEPDTDFDPHAREADAAIAEMNRLRTEENVAYEQSVRDGREESRKKVQGSVLDQYAPPAGPETNGQKMHRLTGAAAEILSRRTPEEKRETARRMDMTASEALGLPREPGLCEHDWGGADVLNDQGETDQVTACVHCGLVAEEDEPFDPTHSADLGNGFTEEHPGKAGDCVLRGCCTHPDGFTYVDDNNGRSGSFCLFCGAEEPEPCAHPGGFTYGGTDEDGEDVWSCAGCGEQENPAVTRMKAHGRAKCRVADLDEGVLFVRHTAKPPLDRLVYRAGPPVMGPLQATIVSAGPYSGRTGPLTNLAEEITCTDISGAPRPRRDLPAPATSDRGAPRPTSNGRSTSSGPRTPSAPRSSVPPPTPSTPRTAPGPTPDQSSTPGTSRTAPSATASSTRATSSGVSGTGSTSTQSATKSGPVADAFVTPKQAVKESDRYDNYGRYKLLHPHTGKPVKWTRATTYAKSIADTYNLSMWSQRMTLKGAAVRPDIVAAVSTLDVKADRDRINALVEDAKKAAGNKVAANLGTAVHSFTEDRDKVLVGEPVEPRTIPGNLLPTVDAYEVLLREFGLQPVPGLIEFTTAVLQYEIAGTSDRCYRVTRDITFKLKGRTVTLYAGEYVIGDVKSGADLSYGWMEICVQLAIYAQGFNSCGVWDWGTGTWGHPVLDGQPEVQIKVRTDVGLIPHLPVDRKEGDPLATLFAVDLDWGWATAVLCGQVRTARKEGNLATALTVADVEDPQDTDPDTDVPSSVHARSVVSRPPTLEEQARSVTTQAAASAVWKDAVAARTPKAEVDRLVKLMQTKLKSHVEQGA